MPAENSRRPRYLVCSTTSPRSTAISLAASSVATSIAISNPSSVVSSSALRNRGLHIVTTAAVLSGFRPRQQHRVTQMHAAGFVAEHTPDKQTLIDLDAVLVFLQQSALAR